ncbi:RHS repeat-associated core domain-containing protein [Flavobacterium branchiophilum]|uniref:RHS repeat-associated core domain-containing protein n=1 Tax=Flavobacterium branchiophilum TaxID=55197 RepID=UPI000A012D2E
MFSRIGKLFIKQRPRLKVTDDDLVYDKKEPIENLITWVYEEGSFAPCAKIVGEERYSIINDYIGRPIQAYNEDGKLIWETDYDIYGQLRNLLGERSFIPFRQLGQYEDEETGLYYNRFRYYSPDSGLYISQDPIGLAGNNPNFYAYTFDSNSRIDIFGLDELYALLANKDGWYPVMEWGKKDPIGEVFLKEGEVWKIGTSKDAKTRYKTKYLDDLNLEMKVLYKDISKKSTLFWENMKLRGYLSWKGFLPAGNKCKH